AEDDVDAGLGLARLRQPRGVGDLAVEAGAHEHVQHTVQVVGLDEDVDVLGGAPPAEIAVEGEPAADEEGSLRFQEGAEPLGVDRLLLLVPALAIACVHDDLQRCPRESAMSARAVPACYPTVMRPSESVVTVSARGAARLRGGHPWVFADDVTH